MAVSSGETGYRAAAKSRSRAGSCHSDGHRRAGTDAVRGVYTENKLALRRYEPDVRRHDVPLVLTYPLVNEPSILDLQSDRSVVGQFLERGFVVYLIDWGDPSRLDAHLALGDFVDRYLRNCVDAARERAPSAAVHLHGYSTGALLAVMYAARYPATVATLTLQGPPLDFDADGRFLDFEALVRAQDTERFVELFGVVPAPFLDVGFSLRKPVEYAITNPLHLYDDFEDRAFVEHVARKSKWAIGGMSVPGATYRQLVEELFEENRLLRNELTLSDTPVDIGAIDMPVLLVIGRDDAFVPPEASRPFLDAIPSDDTAVIEFPHDTRRPVGRHGGPRGRLAAGL